MKKTVLCLCALLLCACVFCTDLTSMGMEAPKRRTATYETFDTGVSTVTFENDGYGETSDTRFTITKDSATIAAIERAKSGPNYDLIIYDSALHEIKRQTLTSQYSASAIQWVGVRDGKLIISEDNCK